MDQFFALSKKIRVGADHLSSIFLRPLINIQQILYLNFHLRQCKTPSPFQGEGWGEGEGVLNKESSIVKGTV